MAFGLLRPLDARHMRGLLEYHLDGCLKPGTGPTYEQQALQKVFGGVRQAWIATLQYIYGLTNEYPRQPSLTIQYYQTTFGTLFYQLIEALKLARPQIIAHDRLLGDQTTAIDGEGEDGTESSSTKNKPRPVSVEISPDELVISVEVLTYVPPNIPRISRAIYRGPESIRLLCGLMMGVSRLDNRPEGLWQLPHNFVMPLLRCGGPAARSFLQSVMAPPVDETQNRARQFHLDTFIAYGIEPITQNVQRYAFHQLATSTAVLQRVSKVVNNLTRKRAILNNFLENMENRSAVQRLLNMPYIPRRYPLHPEQRVRIKKSTPAPVPKLPLGATLEEEDLYYLSIWLREHDQGDMQSAKEAMADYAEARGEYSATDLRIHPSMTRADAYHARIAQLVEKIQLELSVTPMDQPILAEHTCTDEALRFRTSARSNSPHSQHALYAIFMHLEKLMAPYLRQSVSNYTFRLYNFFSLFMMQLEEWLGLFHWENSQEANGDWIHVKFCDGLRKLHIYDLAGHWQFAGALDSTAKFLQHLCTPVPADQFETHLLQGPGPLPSLYLHTSDLELPLAQVPISESIRHDADVDTFRSEGGGLLMEANIIDYMEIMKLWAERGQLWLAACLHAFHQYTRMEAQRYHDSCGSRYPLVVRLGSRTTYEDMTFSLSTLNRRYPHLQLRLHDFHMANGAVTVRPTINARDFMATQFQTQPRHDSVAFLHEGADLCMIFSSHTAHHRYSCYSLMFHYTQRRVQKLVPLTPHLLRLYATQFVEPKLPQDEAADYVIQTQLQSTPVEPRPTAAPDPLSCFSDASRDHLVLFVETLYRQLSRVSTLSSRHAEQTTRHLLLPFDSAHYTIYQLTHELLARISRCSHEFPFFLEEPTVKDGKLDQSIRRRHMDTSKLSAEQRELLFGKPNPNAFPQTLPPKEGLDGVSEYIFGFQQTADIIYDFLLMRGSHFVNTIAAYNVLQYLRECRSHPLGHPKRTIAERHLELFLLLTHMQFMANSLSIILPNFQYHPCVKLIDGKTNGWFCIFASRGAMIEHNLHNLSSFFSHMIQPLVSDKERRTCMHMLFYQFCGDMEVPDKLAFDLLRGIRVEPEYLSGYAYGYFAHGEGAPSKVAPHEQARAEYAREMPKTQSPLDIFVFGKPSAPAPDGLTTPAADQPELSHPMWAELARRHGKMSFDPFDQMVVFARESSANDMARVGNFDMRSLALRKMEDSNIFEDNYRFDYPPRLTHPYVRPLYTGHRWLQTKAFLAPVRYFYQRMYCGMEPEGEDDEAEDEDDDDGMEALWDKYVERDDNGDVPLASGCPMGYPEQSHAPHWNYYQYSTNFARGADFVDTEPMSKFLMTLEWILYDHNAVPYNYGNAAQPTARENEPLLSPATFTPPWNFSANEFVLSESQLQCALPVHFGFVHSKTDVRETFQRPNAITFDHYVWCIQRPRIVSDICQSMSASTLAPISQINDAVAPSRMALEASRCERIMQLLQSNTFNYAHRMNVIVEHLRIIRAAEMQIGNYSPDLIPVSYPLGVRGGTIFKLMRLVWQPRLAELQAYDNQIRVNWARPLSAGVQTSGAPSPSLTRVAVATVDPEAPKRVVTFSMVEFPQQPKRKKAAAQDAPAKKQFVPISNPLRTPTGIPAVV